jgi:hypothetical protein
MSTTQIKKRNSLGNQTQDLGAIGNYVYNQAAGANKVTEVGRHLLPLPTPGSGTGYTTNVSSAAYALPSPGRNLAVYNTSGTAGAITFGTDSTVTALAAGVTDSSGRVGLPCQGNAWSYFAAGYSSWVISSASTLLVFLINDDTSIQVVAPALVSDPTYPNT